MTSGIGLNGHEMIRLQAQMVKLGLPKLLRHSFVKAGTTSSRQLKTISSGYRAALFKFLHVNDAAIGVKH